MGASFVTTHLEPDSRHAATLAFQQLQDQDRYENGHSYSGGFGMVTGLKFTDRQFSDEKTAHEWLANNARKWEHALAVKIAGKPGWFVGAWCSS